MCSSRNLLIINDVYIKNEENSSQLKCFNIQFPKNVLKGKDWNRCIRFNSTLSEIRTWLRCRLKLTN